LASTATHTVWAVGADDGKPLWSYTAGGRVDTPPTVHRDVVLFGSADGWVYCLLASDGQLVWRRRAAPDDVRIVNDDQLESPWPVHGSVLVQDGTAYVAAGRSSFLDGGIYVYAVEPETGEVLRQKRVYSVDPETGDMVDCRLPYDMPPDALGALPDILVGDGTSIYMRHLKLNPTDLSYESSADNAAPIPRRAYPAVGTHLMSVAGLLDQSWFSQTYWTVDGKSHSKLLVFDTETAYGVKPFAASARHSRAIFRPGSKGYTLFANKRPEHQARWSIQVPVRIRAMVLAGSTLFVAGTADVVDPDDPWSAIDGRRGGVLWAVSTAGGKKLAEYPLESPPVFDGIAAAGGRLYISNTNGDVVCLAGE
jgi:outer membrane protein assembly factor BamB